MMTIDPRVHGYSAERTVQLLTGVDIIEVRRQYSLWNKAARFSHLYRGAVVLALVALLACWLPSRWVASAEPLEALRHK